MQQQILIYKLIFVSEVNILRCTIFILFIYNFLFHFSKKKSSRCFKQIYQLVNFEFVVSILKPSYYCYQFLILCKKSDFHVKKTAGVVLAFYSKESTLGRVGQVFAATSCSSQLGLGSSIIRWMNGVARSVGGQAVWQQKQQQQRFFSTREGFTVKTRMWHNKSLENI